ncbi:mitochondrial-processing peptidase subunit beta [Phakopsora pachyrhizi]|uniref:mitochondrial processing peptidase n=1 Tax=Phakopsora pachyrhizi TaxID=170000 RepID=A0AAV0AF10_PHAPC|nr:mitochondrial-processing peptidase subunit beta [Phakopsora pachyrhizi]
MSMSRVFLRSRGLAGNIKRNLRPKISLRSLATAINSSSLPQTRLSTLPNGLTVATEAHPHSQTATVGIWIDSGSRADKHGGTAHFLEHLAFKGTQKRTQHSLELEIENLGAHLNAYTSREQTCYFARSFSSDVPQMVEIISDILQNSKLDEGAIDRERSVILREQEEVDKAHEEVVFDHLHAIAFQDEGLGKTILGPKESILSIQRPDLVEYIKSNYTADRMVLVGAGGLEHEVLVQLAEKNFGKVPTSSSPIPLGGRGNFKPTAFTGSEVRIRDDTMDTINLAIAVEGVGWSSPDLFPMLVMQSIFGNWDRSLGSSPLMSSRLSHTLSSNNLVNSFLSFSTSYSDTGLWGIYLVSENLTNIDDLVFFTLREWQRMSTAPTEIEVARAKSQLKASMLFSLDSSNNIADDIGRQLVTSGRRMTPQEIQAAVEAVTPDTIRKVAQKYLWDKDIAVAALGRTEGLLDYNRIRSNMSSLTW